jgi:predicted Ser/Thr protein kinase
MENQSQPKLIKQINNYVYNTESVIGKGFTSVVYKGIVSNDSGRNSHTK